MGTVCGVFEFLRRTEAEWLVVGLGNPGSEYASTRHNVGFLALDELPAVEGVARCKPQTYMNLSGEAVAPLVRRYGIAPEHVIVLHDELDLPAGTVRVKLGGNENGHNGLKSITEHLGTRNYIRVRIGIGRPPAGISVPDWVLGPISGKEDIAAAAHAAQLVIAEGLAKAQNVIHAR